MFVIKPLKVSILILIKKDDGSKDKGFEIGRLSIGA